MIRHLFVLECDECGSRGRITESSGQVRRAGNAELVSTRSRGRGRIRRVLVGERETRYGWHDPADPPYRAVDRRDLCEGCSTPERLASIRERLAAAASANGDRLDWLLA